MMKARGIASAMAIMLHFCIMVWYYCHDQEWSADQKQLASIMFFGVSFILIGIVGFIGSFNNFPIQTEMTKFHSIFMMLLGTIYLLHYSGIMITTNKDKLIMICSGSLLASVIIFVSAFRHKFFNKKTYDG